MEIGTIGAGGSAQACRFSAATGNSARAAVVVFGPPLDSEPAGRTVSNEILVRLNMIACHT
jgi:hypothetical protein